MESGICFLGASAKVDIDVVVGALAWFGFGSGTWEENGEPFKGEDFEGGFLFLFLNGPFCLTGVSNGGMMGIAEVR